MQTNNKLREALKECLLYITCAESVGVGTITLNDKVKLDPKKIIKSAKEALAATPRNCERFRNADEALDALERHCNSSDNGCIRCPVAEFSTEEVECKIAWLFALATEQKGGNDAD